MDKQRHSPALTALAMIATLVAGCASTSDALVVDDAEWCSGQVLPESSSCEILPPRFDPMDEIDG